MESRLRRRCTDHRRLSSWLSSRTAAASEFGAVGNIRSVSRGKRWVQPSSSADYRGIFPSGQSGSLPERKGTEATGGKPGAISATETPPVDTA